MLFLRYACIFLFKNENDFNELRNKIEIISADIFLLNSISTLSPEFIEFVISL